MNYRLTAFVLGEIVLILGVLLCVPLFIAIGFNETNTIIPYVITISICLGLGIVGVVLKPKKDKRNFKPAGGLIMCGLAWIIIGIITAIPYRISGVIPNFFDALFESFSGYSTTGASVFNSVEGGIVPKSMLFLRSYTQFIGGMGVLVFVIAVLPKNDKSSTALVRAEMPGPQFNKLVSKLRFTTRILYAIYIVLTFILVGILCACKMPVFDSFCHAFSTASTGGFSIWDDSIAHYNSLSIEIIITVFMMIFSVNFNLYFLIITGHILRALKDEEFVYMWGIYFGAVVAIVISLCAYQTYTFGQSIRYTTFQVASIMSTTGFATQDYTTWPVIAQALLAILMLLGGSAGSTAGGVKVSRIMILGKSSYVNLKKTLSPRSVKCVKINRQPLPEMTITSVENFFVLYVVLIMISTVLISIGSPYEGNDGFLTNFTAVLTCISNVGPGFAFVGPMCNYADYNGWAKIILSIDMLLGRLEIMPIIMLFNFKAWKKS